MALAAPTAAPAVAGAETLDNQICCGMTITFTPRGGKAKTVTKQVTFRLSS
jgi:ribosomal protein S27E